MTNPHLPPVPLYRLSSKRLRDNFRAPDLERYLTLRDADLGAIDQVDALKIRVRRGIEVVTERARSTALLARRRAMLRVSLIGAVSGIALAGAWTFRNASLGWWPLIAFVIGSLVLFARSGVVVFRDTATLRRIAKRYDLAVAVCQDMDELKVLSQEIFDEADRVAGGGDRTAPPATSD